MSKIIDKRKFRLTSRDFEEMSRLQKLIDIRIGDDIPPFDTRIKRYGGGDHKHQYQLIMTELSQWYLELELDLLEY